MLDIHSHILPGVDDGAKSFLESKILLEQLSAQGINTVVATPHFYPDTDDLKEFLEKRSSAYEEIRELCNQNNIKMLFGFEVMYFSGMSEFPGIKELTIDGSKYLLLELLGLKVINDKVIKDIINLKEVMGITPVIAHIERYYKYKGYKKLLQVIENNQALCQINATFICFPGETRAVKKFIKAGQVHFVGSDCHDTQNRAVYLKSAYEAIRKMSKEQYDRIISYNEKIERELLAANDKQIG